MRLNLIICPILKRIMSMVKKISKSASIDRVKFDSKKSGRKGKLRSFERG